MFGITKYLRRAEDLVVSFKRVVIESTPCRKADKDLFFHATPPGPDKAASLPCPLDYIAGGKDRNEIS